MLKNRKCEYNFKIIMFQTQINEQSSYKNYNHEYSQMSTLNSVKPNAFQNGSQ